MNTKFCLNKFFLVSLEKCFDNILLFSIITFSHWMSIYRVKSSNAFEFVLDNLRKLTKEHVNVNILFCIAIFS